MLDPKIFFWVAVSVADAAAVNPNSIKTLLEHFSLKTNKCFSNGRKSLPKNPPDCPILCN